jgi:hypothetical protein
MTDSTRAANSMSFIFTCALGSSSIRGSQYSSTRAANSNFPNGFDQGGKLRIFSTGSTGEARPEAFYGFDLGGELQSLRIRPSGELRELPLRRAD